MEIIASFCRGAGFLRTVFISAIGIFVLGAGAVTAHADTITLNFDSVAAAGLATGVDSTAYFGAFGITLSSVTAGTKVAILDNNQVYGGAALTLTSSPNLLMQIGSNSAVSFNLNFSQPLISFGFTIPDDAAPSSFPWWEISAYNGATLLSSASQGVTCCHAGPLSYTLNGPNITRVVVKSQNFNTAFSGIPLDNLVLTRPDVTPVSEPGSLILLFAGLALLVPAARRRK